MRHSNTETKDLKPGVAELKDTEGCAINSIAALFKEMKILRQIDVTVPSFQANKFESPKLMYCPIIIGMKSTYHDSNE